MKFTYDHEKLKSRRLDLRMTQIELAKRCGVTHGAVSLVENGKAPWIKVIREMERVLGVSVAIKTNGKRSA